MFRLVWDLWVEFGFRLFVYALYLISSGFQIYYYHLEDFNKHYCWSTLGLFLTHLAVDRISTGLWFHLEWNRRKITETLPNVFVRAAAFLLWPFVPLDSITFVIQRRIRQLQSGRRLATIGELRMLDIRRSTWASLSRSFSNKSMKDKAESVEDILEAEWRTEEHGICELDPNKADDLCDCVCRCACSQCNPVDRSQGKCNQCILKACSRFCDVKGCSWCAAASVDERRAWDKEIGICSCPTCRCINIKCGFIWRCSCVHCVKRRQLLATSVETLLGPQTNVHRLPKGNCKACGCTCSFCLRGNCSDCEIRRRTISYILPRTRRRKEKRADCSCSNCRFVDVEDTNCKCVKCICRRCINPKKNESGVTNKECSCSTCEERASYLAQKRSVARGVVSELESLPPASAGCVRRRKRRANCFDCDKAAVDDESREKKEETKYARGGSEKLAKEFEELVKCRCTKCRREPCEYHRIMSFRCEKCQSRAQLIADVNELEKEIKKLGIPKAILSLAEFALQTYIAASFGFVTINHIVLLCSTAVYCSLDVFATFQLRRAIGLAWWQNMPFLLNVFCKIVIGVVPITLVLDATLALPSTSFPTGIVVLTLLSLGGLLFQLLLFLISGRHVRLGLRTGVAFANLAFAGAALYLHYEISWEQFPSPRAYPSPSLNSRNGRADNQTNLLWNITGVPWGHYDAAAPEADEIASGLCANGRSHVFLSDVRLSLELAEYKKKGGDLFSLPGVEVVYYCFLSLHDVYVELVRAMYVVLILSLDFVPIMLFVYPWRRYEPLEKAMGINLDRMTCYLLPVVSLFMLLFVIAIEFQLNDGHD